MNVGLPAVLPSTLGGCSLGEEEYVVMTDVLEWCTGERVCCLQHGTQIVTEVLLC